MLSALVSGDASRYDGVEALEAGTLAAKALLDALARAINSACHLGIRPRYLNWSVSGELVHKVADNQPALHALVTSPLVQAFMKVVSELRNTIHAEPLSEALLERRPGRTESVALVPRDVASGIETELHLLGLLAPWQAGNSPTLLLDPAQVLHDVMRWTASLASAICTTAKWPVIGVAPPLEVSNPQNLRWERNVKRNRWLYGADVWGTEPPLGWSAQAI
jgi:hypothetical protein